MADLRDQEFPAIEALAIACCIYRQKGYTNTTTYLASDPGGDQRWNNKDMLTFQLFPMLANHNYLLKFDPTIADVEEALAIIKHFRKLSFGVIGDTINDYMSRVFKVTQNENVKLADLGVIASVPQVYDREVSEKRIKTEIENTIKGYLGQEGDTIELDIRYIRTKPVPKLGCYSHEAITSGNYLVSFLSKELQGIAGTTHKIRAKVKKHSVNFLTKTPETQLNYVKVVDKEFVWQ